MTSALFACNRAVTFLPYTGGMNQIQLSPSTHPSTNIASFLLRFTQERWEDAQREPHVRWRGHIRHVQGAAEDRFTDFSQAAAFMQQNLAALTRQTFAADSLESRERVLREGVKLWEQFAVSYTQTVSHAWEQAVDESVKSSERLRQRVETARDQTLRLWGLPLPLPEKQGQPSSERERALAAKVESLRAQVATLEARIGELESN